MKKFWKDEQVFTYLLMDFILLCHKIHKNRNSVKTHD